jgi:hypothetical protein
MDMTPLVTTGGVSFLCRRGCGLGRMEAGSLPD